MTDDAKNRMTYAELKAELDKLTPEQLAQPAIWSGDERGGYVLGVYIFEEDWLGDRSDGETWMPRSEWAKPYCDDDRENAVVCIPVGSVHLEVD